MAAGQLHIIQSDDDWCAIYELPAVVVAAAIAAGERAELPEAVEGALGTIVVLGCPVDALLRPERRRQFVALAQEIAADLVENSMGRRPESLLVEDTAPSGGKAS